MWLLTTSYNHSKAKLPSILFLQLVSIIRLDSHHMCRVANSFCEVLLSRMHTFLRTFSSHLLVVASCLVLHSTKVSHTPSMFLSRCKVSSLSRSTEWSSVALQHQAGHLKFWCLIRQVRSHSSLLHYDMSGGVTLSQVCLSKFQFKSITHLSNIQPAIPLAMHPSKYLYSQCIISHSLKIINMSTFNLPMQVLGIHCSLSSFLPNPPTRLLSTSLWICRED